MQESPLPTISAQEMTKNSPQPELAMMTNVNVLDLQKEYIDDNKIYTKDNTVYMYTSATNHASSLHDGTEDDIKDDHHQHHHHSLIQSVVQPDDNSQILDEQHIITDNHSEQLLTKLAISDDHILRLVGPNGESQQIISREIINGEHHILTRNENGEHTITRIVSADNHCLLSSSDNAIYSSHSTASSGAAHQQQHLNQHKIITTSPSDSGRHSQQPHQHQQQQHQHQQHHSHSDHIQEPHHVIYTTASSDTDQMSASAILEQYDDNENAANLQAKGRDGVHQQSYDRNSAELHLHRGVVHSNGSHHDDDKHNKHQVIYTHDAAKDDDDDDELFANDNHKSSSSGAVSAATNSMYTTSGGGASDEKAPLDLIYEDGVGGKTVIYTTTGDNKSLELYAGNDLSMLGEGQVIVQGGLQYSTQQLHGQTVFVVSDAALVNGDMGAQIHQR